MAAQRPENSEEQLVADALQRAFGGPVAPAAFLAGREAVRAAAAMAKEEAAADADLVGAALTGAFAVPVDSDVKTDQVAAIRAAAESSNVIPLRRIGQRVGRHAVAAMVAVSTLAGGSGVAAASTDALPGETLYPVKRAVEQVMLTAAWTPTAEAAVQTKLAERRLVEVERLLASGASPHLLQPLLDEYDQHVAVVENLHISETALQVAVLEEKADALREQTVIVAADDDSADAAEGSGATLEATEPPEATEPATVTTTEAPKTEASESTAAADAQPPPPAPAPSTSSGSGERSTSGSTSGSTSTQPQPTTDASPTPSPTPTPSATPTPTRPPQSGTDGAKDGGKTRTEKPTASPSPTVNPERTPLSDSEPVNDAGPLADWEETATYTDDS